MTKAKPKVILLLTLFLILSQVIIARSSTELNEDARSAVYNAFKALIEAYNAGGDVSNLTETLNKALNLTSEAEATAGTNPSEAQALLSEAKTLAENVTDQTPLIGEEGLRQGQTWMIITIASVIGAIITGVLIYVFGPDILWRLWLRLRKDYIVKVTGVPKQEKGFVITMDQVCAAILGIILIIAVFMAAQFFLTGRTGETFSELGILGPQMRLGDYPKEVVAGDAVNLFVYIGNQMGGPVYYSVMIKIGDNNTSVNPAPIETSMKLEKILQQNQNWTSPINIKLTQAGLNQRIIFELWTYNDTMGGFEYNQRWGQIWLNVTAPP
ncbi:MAG TPA: DUF1616 domain-containing protein [Candidatus Bathyarchaeia archaeon]|nr:DUF1616 domain-containing protein [Candidatus Bathyarchaeia archaeon]